MEKENEIDQMFKRGLSDPEIPYEEKDWIAMESMLDQKPGKKVFPIWLYATSGTAAALLLLLFWFPSGKPDRPKTKDAQVIARSRALPGNLIEKQIGEYPSLKRSFRPMNDNRYVAPKLSLNIPSPFMVEHDNTVLRINAKPVAYSQPLSVHESDSAITARKAIALAQSKDPLERLGKSDITRSVQKEMDRQMEKQPMLILSAMAGPDISRVDESKSSKVSKNAGLLATYSLSKRFSVTSGAVYGKKYYNSAGSASADDGSAYAPQYGSADWEIRANCDVIDVPLNINYKIVNKSKLSISLNSGLSSYFMLKEKYEYTRQQPGREQQVTTTSINDQNQHIFGIANVSVSIDHQISEKLSIGVQPFAKLPLTGIGNYDANLRSAGVSFSLNIGLFHSNRHTKVTANRYSFTN